MHGYMPARESSQRITRKAKIAPTARLKKRMLGGLLGLGGGNGMRPHNPGQSLCDSAISTDRNLAFWLL